LILRRQYWVDRACGGRQGRGKRIEWMIEILLPLFYSEENISILWGFERRIGWSHIPSQWLSQGLLKTLRQ